LDPVTADQLCGALGDDNRKPRLVFLSACRTAERGQSGSAPFTQALARSGVANVVGWDGSVHDGDARLFATAFYRELAGGHSVAYAAGKARSVVLNFRAGAHWHLARVYLGTEGGGALCRPSVKPRNLKRVTADKAYLDMVRRRVPVATAEQFVGRRRSIQHALRAWNAGCAGVLIQGMGNLGKSSLAARIASRSTDHRLVVVFERYDARTVLDALADALPPTERAAFKSVWEPGVAADPWTLKDALQDLLENAFSGCAFDGCGVTIPILLIIDDLERLLADPKPGETATPFKTPEGMAVVGAIIAAFRDAGAGTQSRLLITSRYTFILTDRRGDDLAARLSVVALPPMDENQRARQMLTAARLNGLEGDAGTAPDLEKLEARIRRAAGGNPGLQEILTRPLLDRKKGAAGIAAATRAVEAVESYLGTGEVPTEESAAVEFFKRVSLQAFRAMLTPTEETQLSAATLFEQPVPLSILGEVGKAVGIADPLPALGRLQGLGLLDRYGGAGDTVEAAINPLARPLVPALGPKDQAHLASVAVAPLDAMRRNSDGDLPSDARSVEIARLAILAVGPPEIAAEAALAGGRFLFHSEHKAEKALKLVEAAVNLIGGHAVSPSPRLLILGAECAERLGQGDTQDDLLKRALTIPDISPDDHDAITFRYASRLTRKGNFNEAMTHFQNLADRFAASGDVRSRAVTMGQIADILQARGELGEALRICREEELPVFERLGDVRSRAVTMGRIADILQARGELGEALRIHIEERLPVAEEMGDADSLAHIRYRCGTIRLARGGWEGDEAQVVAAEIFQSFSLYRQLGDANGVGAVGLLFAQILSATGQTDTALNVLDEAAAAFTNLEDEQGLQRVRDLRNAITEASE
jgi:tetratricopeptide (TPR) repeat protein